MEFSETILTHDCSREHLEAIGNITVSYANLQWTLEIVACALLNDLQEDKRGIVTSNLTFSQLTRLLDGLFVHHEPKPIGYDQFAGVLKRLDDVARRRNRLNHAMVLPMLNELKLVSFDKSRRGKGLKALESSFSIEDLRLLANDIQRVGGDLLALFSRLKTDEWNSR